MNLGLAAVASEVKVALAVDCLGVAASRALAAPLHGSARRDNASGWDARESLDSAHAGTLLVRREGSWRFALVEIDDREMGLQEASRRAYSALFSWLAREGALYPARFWNYVAEINREQGGSERYRQFNAGRQQAFFDARHDAFEGAPAACALGVRSGPLRVAVLAGPQTPVAVENPRQVSAYRYPVDYGPRPPSFSRAAWVELEPDRQALLVSGTASIVGHETRHAGDVRAQADETLRNLEAVLRAAARTGPSLALSDLVCTVYLRHADDLEPVRERVEPALGPAAAQAAVWYRADICRSDLLVEIEAHALAPQGTAACA